MNNPARRLTRKARIQEISQEIENLSAELNQLIIQDNQEEDIEIRNTDIDQPQFQEGNRIEITNSYKGQQGLRGTITKVTAKQVSIRIDGQRRIINKKKTNVRLIE
jgi:uncharacterized sporulation protein YeaH/YhbH (DUF444 family)